MSFSSFFSLSLLRKAEYDIISPLITTLNVSHNNDGDIESVLLVNRKLSIAQDMNWQKFSSDSKVVFSLHADRAG